MEEILRPVKRILCILFIAVFVLSGVAQMAFAEPDGDAQLPDNGIPVVVIEIDETSGHTIEDMNSSDEHNVDCYGTMQIIVPEGFRACDMDSAPDSLGPVDLVMVGKEDGVEVSRTFLGNYCLAEQVRVDENRLNIPELKSGHTDPETARAAHTLK